jgi:hypothetical protein
MITPLGFAQILLAFSDRVKSSGNVTFLDFTFFPRHLIVQQTVDEYPTNFCLIVSPGHFSPAIICCIFCPDHYMAHMLMQPNIFWLMTLPCYGWSSY